MCGRFNIIDSPDVRLLMEHLGVDMGGIRFSGDHAPASAFIEGLGDKRTYHKIELEGQAIAFGGLYQEYVNRDTGESAIGASIITLPPPPAWKHIHPRSMPLMLPTDNTAVLDAWLDPDVSDVQRFEDLLSPQIRVAQVLTPIGKVSQWNEIGDSFLLG